MKLHRSDVAFIDSEHRYILGDKDLTGITGIIEKMLFPDKYASIPKHILEKAAQKGSLIHKLCQENDIFDIETDVQEVISYREIKEENGLETVANEYLVSDNSRIATMIDVVFKAGENSVHLADIKTTSKLDEEYLSWQLSICARLFVLNNPDIKVERLYGIWLRGDKKKLVEIKRMPDEEVDKLIDSYFSGTEYLVPVVNSEHNNELAKLAAIEEHIVMLKSEMDSLEEYKSNLLKVIEEQMILNNVKKWETDNLIITRVLPTETSTFDSKKFRDENPDIYNKYTRKTTKKGFLKLKVK